jgi:hypothetical protein
MWRFAHVVLSQSLNSDILMMHPAENWNRCDRTDPLRPPKVRNIFMRRKMRPNFVVIRGIVFQNVAKVRSAERHQVVE